MRCQSLGRLRAQTIALLDAEAVLLVDDDHAEAGEFDRVLQQRMGADDDARIACGDLVANLPFLSRAHRTGEQGHPGGAVGTAELTGHGQRTEDVADRPGVLGGEHLGGRQQRALVAGVDHLQHRQHRDDGLAGTHLALQQPVHRSGSGQFAGDHLENLALPGGQFVGQPGHQRRHQPAVAGRCGRAGLRHLAVAAVRQRPLQPDRFVEGQPPTRLVALGLLLRDVDVAQCGVLAHQMTPVHNRLRERLGDRVEHGKDLANAGVDVPALQFGAGRVDREEVAFEHRQVQPAAGVAAGLGDGLQRLGAAEAARGRVQDEVSRMGELHGALVVAHLAGQHQPGSRHQLLLEVLGVEERRGHLRTAVAQGDDEVLAARGAVGPADVGLLDLPDEGDVLTLLRRIVVLAANRHALAVLTGVVAQQVFDGADAEDIVEGAGSLRAEQRLETVGE